MQHGRKVIDALFDIVARALLWRPTGLQRKSSTVHFCSVIYYSPLLVATLLTEKSWITRNNVFKYLAVLQLFSYDMYYYKIINSTLCKKEVKSQSISAGEFPVQASKAM